VKGKYLVWGSVLSGLGFLGWYLNKQATYAKKLEYKVTGYKLVAVGLEGARIDLNVSLFNKGKLEIFIKRLKLNVFAEGNFIATIYNSEGVTVLPNADTQSTIQIILNPTVLLQSAGNILSNISTTNKGWENIVLTIDGNASIAQGVIPFYVPIKYSFKLSELSKA